MDQHTQTSLLTAQRTCVVDADLGSSFLHTSFSRRDGAIGCWPYNKLNASLLRPFGRCGSFGFSFFTGAASDVPPLFKPRISLTSPILPVALKGLYYTTGLATSLQNVYQSVSATHKRKCDHQATQTRILPLTNEEKRLKAWSLCVDRTRLRTRDRSRSGVLGVTCHFAGTKSQLSLRQKYKRWETHAYE